MALPAIQAKPVQQVLIPDGRYIILDDLPSENHKSLIANIETYNVEGYLPIGCSFPDASKREPYSADSSNNIFQLIAGNTIYVQKMSTLQVDTTVYPRNISVGYAKVQGDVVIAGETIKQDDDIYLPIRNASPADIDPKSDPEIYYVVDNKQDSTQNKVYIIKRSDSTIQVDDGTGGTKTIPSNRFVSIDEITDEVDDAVLQTLTNAKIQHQNNEVGIAAVNNAVINSAISDDRIRIAELKQIITVNVYPALLLRDNIDSVQASDLNDQAKFYNKRFLIEGWAYYTNNTARMSDEDVDLRNTVFNWTINTVPEQISSTNGMFTSPYWQRERVINRINFPTSISFSKLHTYTVCPYRYYVLAYDKPSSGGQSDKVDLLTGEELNRQKAAILGTIIHYNAEFLIRQIVNNGGQPVSNLNDFTKIAQQHIMGSSAIDTIDDYDFSAIDVRRLSERFKKDSVVLMTTVFENINTREYYDGFDTFMAEVDINDAFITVKGRKIRVLGRVDGLLENSTTGEVSIFDVKSNKEPFTDDDGFKTYQVVWYLYFLQQLTPIIQGSDSITIPAGLGNTNVNTFFDFNRHSEADIYTVQPSQRQIIWNRILSALEDLVDSITEFEADTNQDASKIFWPRTNKFCWSCPVLATCPDPNVRGNSQTAVRRNLLQTQKNTFTVVANKKNLSSIDSIDERILMDNIQGYSKLAKGLISSLPKADKLTKNRHKVISRELIAVDSTIETQIGAIYITSPITQIQMIDSKRHEVFNTLRSPASTVFRVEGTNKSATISIRFNSASKINTEMRHIIAQYYAFPFFSVRNPDITRAFMPFETHKDIYYVMGHKIQPLVKKYFRLKKGDNRDRPTIERESPASIKQQIYNKARLFYGVANLSVESVPDSVDTVDLTMQLTLHDVFATTTNGRVEYLMDSHATMSQLAWMYNSSTPSSDSKLKRSILNSYSQDRKLAEGSSAKSASSITVTINRTGDNRDGTSDITRSGPSVVINLVTPNATGILPIEKAIAASSHHTGAATGGGSEISPSIHIPGQYSSTGPNGNLHVEAPIQQILLHTLRKLTLLREPDNKSKIGRISIDRLDIKDKATTVTHTTIRQHLDTINRDSNKQSFRSRMSPRELITIKSHIDSVFLRRNMNLRTGTDTENRISVDIPIFSTLIRYTNTFSTVSENILDTGQEFGTPNDLVPLISEFQANTDNITVIANDTKSTMDFTESFLLQGQLHLVGYTDWRAAGNYETMVSAGYARWDRNSSAKGDSYHYLQSLPTAFLRPDKLKPWQDKTLDTSYITTDTRVDTGKNVTTGKVDAILGVGNLPGTGAVNMSFDTTVLDKNIDGDKNAALLYDIRTSEVTTESIKSQTESTNIVITRIDLRRNTQNALDNVLIPSAGIVTITDGSKIKPAFEPYTDIATYGSLVLYNVTIIIPGKKTIKTMSFPLLGAVDGLGPLNINEKAKKGPTQIPKKYAERLWMVATDKSRQIYASTIYKYITDNFSNSIDIIRTLFANVELDKIVGATTYLYTAKANSTASPVTTPR